MRSEEVYTRERALWPGVPKVSDSTVLLAKRDYDAHLKESPDTASEVHLQCDTYQELERAAKPATKDCNFPSQPPKSALAGELFASYGDEEQFLTTFCSLVDEKMFETPAAATSASAHLTNASLRQKLLQARMAHGR